MKSSLIGILFLVAFIVFGFGEYYLNSQWISQKIIGSILITLNSIIVFAIGVLISAILIDYNKLVSRVYLVTRSIEALFLFFMIFSSFGVFKNIGNQIFYNIAMLTLGLGSIPMCWLLWKNKIIPSWLSVWGLIGYTIFSIGSLFVFVEISNNILFLLPGGLWELFFGFWLIIKNRINV
ncbi:MAG TPA: DUF4386 domain-containing protein [Flavobacterium sp.]|uniref:DUF4386 domain-containing protein n=1 Tax=unclassified Flavobacterium TaxID=196869 RepID=UPI0025B8EBFF|nr:MULTISPECIES: DUF4386 domain-containing protein [unclassified Flavobacterium]HRE76824.1 DUF4386 domain-containing protein [Flavobacterium sp.]